MVHGFTGVLQDEVVQLLREPCRTFLNLVIDQVATGVTVSGRELTGDSTVGANIMAKKFSKCGNTQKNFL